MTSNTHNESNGLNDQDRAHKIQNLRDMISNAEQTIQSAKSMLLQLEGKKKAGRKRKVEEIEGSSVVQGSFDGQIMIGTDGKSYPVPANYASKSKLVQGDTLKLTITEDGSFIYKQIGPADRRHAIGIVSQDENGNYFIVTDGRAYRVLLASITYFRAEPGDEVAIVLPRDENAQWAAIENILQKASLMGDKNTPPIAAPLPKKPATDMEHWKKDVQDATPINSPEITITTPGEDTPTDEKSSPNDNIDSDADETSSEESKNDMLRQEIIDSWMKEIESDNQKDQN